MTKPDFSVIIFTNGSYPILCQTIFSCIIDKVRSIEPRYTGTGTQPENIIPVLDHVKYSGLGQSVRNRELVKIELLPVNSERS